MSSLLSVQKFLTHCLELHRQGGSVFVRDAHTVILTDRYVFSHAHYELLVSQFPHIRIDVVSSVASKSGFLVLFTCPTPYNNVWQRSVLILCMHLVFFIATCLCTLRGLV